MPTPCSTWMRLLVMTSRALTSIAMNLAYHLTYFFVDFHALTLVRYSIGDICYITIRSF